MSATPITYRSELDQLRCPDCARIEPNAHPEPNAGHVLYPACHPDVLTSPLYHEGELRLECAECGQIWLAVLVAG